VAEGGGSEGGRRVEGGNREERGGLWRVCASSPSRYVLVINDNHLVSLMDFNEVKEN
jgi:hypothetical protein